MFFNIFYVWLLNTKINKQLFFFSWVWMVVLVNIETKKSKNMCLFLIRELSLYYSDLLLLLVTNNIQRRGKYKISRSCPCWSRCRGNVQQSNKICPAKKYINVSETQLIFTCSDPKVWSSSYFLWLEKFSGKLKASSVVLPPCPVSISIWVLEAERGEYRGLYRRYPEQSSQYQQYVATSGS